MINAENGNPYSTLFAIGKKMYQMLLVFGFVGVFLDCLFLFFFPWGEVKLLLKNFRRTRSKQLDQ